MLGPLEGVSGFIPRPIPPIEGKGAGGGGRTTDGGRAIVPEEETIALFADIVPLGFATEELITDEGDIPSTPVTVFDS